MALWSSAPPTAPPTSPRLLGTRFSPIAWELGLQEVADASNWEWQTASVVASSLIVLSTCLLLAAWAAMRCLAHLLSRVAKAADDAAAADEAALLSPSLPRSQERSGSDIECHSVPVGVCAETSGNLPTSGALTTASILLPRNVQLPAPHCTTRGLMPLAGVPAAPSLPATPTAARRSGEPARSPPSRKYLEAYCRAQSLTRPAPAAAASHNGAGAGSDGDPFGAPGFRQDQFGAPVFRQDQFGAPVFAPSGPNRESVFASSLGLPLVPPLQPRRLLPAPPPGAAAPYSASPQSGLSELPELSRELSRELSGESPVSPRPYSPGGTATAGYSPPTFIGRSVGVVLGMHEGEDTRKVPIAGVFLPQIEFELSRLAREAAERVAPAVRAAKEEIAKHFEDIEEAAAAEAKARVAAAAEAAAAEAAARKAAAAEAAARKAAAAEAAAAEAAAAEAAARKAAAAAEAMAKEAVAEAGPNKAGPNKAGPNKAGPNKAGAEATAEVAAEVAEVAEEVAAVAVTRALSRSAAAEAAAAEVAAAEKAAAEAAAHAEKEKAAAVKLAAEKAAQAQAQMVEAEKAAAERCAKARRASAAKAREKATAQPVAVAVPSPVRRAAARQVLLAVRKRSLAAFDEINLATLDLAIEQLQLDLATISQPQLDLATVAWSEQSSDHHSASACVPGSKESSIAKLATVGSRMEVLMSLDGS